MNRVALVERQAVAEQNAQRTVTTAMRMKALHHRGQYVLLPHQPAVEKRQAWTRHHQNQRRAHQHPGVVAGVAGVRHLPLELGHAGLNFRRSSLCRYRSELIFGRRLRIRLGGRRRRSRRRLGKTGEGRQAAK